MKTDALAPTAREVRILRAVAHPARFRIVGLLAERKGYTCAQLAEALPFAQSSLFDHLALLCEEGIVQVSMNGPNHYYCLAPSTIDLLSAYLSGLGQQARSWTELVRTTQKKHHLEIREATCEDAASTAHISNQGIEDRSATLETQLRTAEERAEWLATCSSRYSMLVAVENGERVVGWASLNPFNLRPVYGYVADISVYVTWEERGRGIGDALMSALEARARSLGYHKMVPASFPTYVPGTRLYERHNFRTAGIYHEQGMLDDRWVDVIIMEKILH